MHILPDLILREIAMLALLWLIGIGPASFLGERFGAVGRFALAPVFGLCLGVIVTITLLQYEPVSATWWAVIPLAAASVALAAFRVLRTRTGVVPAPRHLLQLLIVGVIVVAPATVTLHDAGTVGPVALNVYDAAGYVTEMDSEQVKGIEQATRPTATAHQNLAQDWWTGYASGFQNVDATPLQASFDDLLGLKATDTQSSFMIDLLVIQALGAFMALRYLLERDTAWAVLAGALFAGPFFLQLWADSSQAALCGLSLMLPAFMVGYEILRERRLADVALGALLLSGLLSIYPVLVPQLLGGAAILLIVAAVITKRRGERLLPLVFAYVWRAALLVVLACVITPIAFGRDLRYWKAILDGNFSYASLPKYHLPVAVLPGWLLQTRQFYFLSDIGTGGLHMFVIAVILPAIFLALIIYGLVRRPRLLLLLAFVVVCAALAEDIEVTHHCEYCVQRNLLPVGPIVAVLMAAGVATLVAAHSRLIAAGGVVLAALMVVSVGERTRQEHLLVDDTGYLLDSADRVALSHLPRDHGYVSLEGYGADSRGPGELPLVNDLVNEHTNEHGVIPLAAPDYSSFAYIAEPGPPGPWYHANYRYVLTRFPAIRTDRRTIFTYAGVALQERTAALDITPVAGIGAPETREDPSGQGWVQGGLLPEPLGFYINGPTKGRVWAKIEFATEEAVALDPGQHDIRYRLRPGTPSKPGTLTACIPAHGSAPTRTAKIGLSFTPIPGPIPHAAYTLPPVAEGVEVIGMFAQTGHCTP